MRPTEHTPSVVAVMTRLTPIADIFGRDTPDLTPCEPLIASVRMLTNEPLVPDSRRRSPDVYHGSGVIDERERPAGSA